MQPVGARPWDRGAKGWFVRWVEDGRRRAKRVAPPGPEGEEVAREVAERLNRAAERMELWQASPQQPLPVCELVRAWRDRCAPLRSVRTQITDQGLVERLAVYFGTRDVRELRNPDMRDFAAAVIREGRSGHTAANALSVLRRVLNLAVEDGLLERNPVSGWGPVLREVRRRTLEEAPTRDAWSPAETVAILALAEQHEHRLAPVLLAAFHTGARRGELLALKWQDVDLGGLRLQVRRASAAKGGTKTPKAHSGRLVPLSRTLAAVLKRHRESQRRSTLRGRREPPVWVFPGARGGLWEEHHFSRVWRRLRRRFKAEIRPLPFHCTRHTYITRCLENLTPVNVVADRVGASPEVIQAHYAHVIDRASSYPVDFLDVLVERGTQRNLDGTASGAKCGDPGAIRTRDPQLRRFEA